MSTTRLVSCWPNVQHDTKLSSGAKAMWRIWQREKQFHKNPKREEEEKDWGGNYNKTVPEDAKKTT